jgi:hypothetical protein
MSQIEQVVKQIQSEFRLDAEGKALVSIRGAARLASVDESSIRSSLHSAGQKPSKMAEFLMRQALKGADLASWTENGIPDIGLALILEYFAYETQPRYRTEQSRLCCRAFSAIGIRAWIHESIGWKKPESQKLISLTQENRLEAAKLGAKLLEYRHDERLLMTLQAEVKNLLAPESSEPSQPKMMSATEWLGTLGYRPPTNKENWLGRKIADKWRLERKTEPKTAPKFVGTNHETQIKVYPEDFLPIIIEVTEGYCGVDLSNQQASIGS